VLFGIYDLETEFSNTKPMSLFLSKNLTWNTALDQSGTMPQNGSIGPGNYPYTPLAVRVRQQLSPGISVQVVLANAASDNPRRQSSNDVAISPTYGALGIAELDYTPSPTTKLMAGVWGLTSRLPVNGQYLANGAQRTVAGQQGGYIGGATRLYSLEGKRGLDGFFTLGLSSQQSTNTSQSINGGLVYTGLLNARPHDKAGVSFNVNTAPDSFRRAQLARGIGFRNNEASFEATYRAKITDWLTLQPDVQYIVNPGYAPKAKDDLVFGLHVEIGHLFDL
jgi:porin